MPLHKPIVTVLLATFNGAIWLDEQLNTIECQEGVDVSVVASDDGSSDTTLLILKRPRSISISVMSSLPGRLGGAHRNFFRLIRDADIGNAEYVALADQDDLWLPAKLKRAISCLNTHSAQGYSGNVTAVWSNGQTRLIEKAQQRRMYDHLFGSPGPGCTFVLPRQQFDQLRAFVGEHFDCLQFVWMHDWLIYAFVRSRGGHWHIDEVPMMLYRQHGENVIGANHGWRAAVGRMRRVRSGSYRKDILAIAGVLNESAECITWLRRLSLSDRLRLVLNVRQYRRRTSECLALGVFVLLMPRSAESASPLVKHQSLGSD